MVVTSLKPWRHDSHSGVSGIAGAVQLFIMVGAAPNTEWLSGLVELDDKGFVITGRGAELVTSPFGTRSPACSQWVTYAQDRSSA
jgi:thioredoxin reductase (NADPH)